MSMQALIEELIAKAPPENEKAIECQILNRVGAMSAGPLRQHPAIPGILVQTTIAQSKGGQPTVLELYFTADDIVRLEILKGEHLVKPANGGLIVPGMSRQ
jgi:hypothetical protein